MPKGFILMAAATVATLGSVAITTPASAQYYHGHDRGWHGGGYYGHARRAHWRHDRERRWHHRGHYRGYGRGGYGHGGYGHGYYGHHHRGY